jgi:hypothetical protein
MNSIEWLRNELWEQFKWSFSDNIFEVAKEMHKQEILQTSKDSYISGYIDNQCKIDDSMNFPDEYYEETFLSKGSDDHISDISKMVKISDEEIEKAVNEYTEVYQCPSEISMCKHDVISAWNNGIKWYREQLKQRQ